MTAEEIESEPCVKIPDKMLHQNKETDTVIVGGKENDNILADSKNVSSEEQSTGTGATGEGGEDGAVRGGSGRTVRGSGADNNRSDDKGSTGRVHGKNKKSEHGKKGSPGTNKQRLDGVREEPVNYHITDADKLGSGGATTKARANIKAIRTTVLFNKDWR
jgi:hypothetical protein